MIIKYHVGLHGMKEQTRMENVDVMPVEDMCHQVEDLIAMDALHFMIFVQPIRRPARRGMKYLA